MGVCHKVSRKLQDKRDDARLTNEFILDDAIFLDDDRILEVRIHA
jgi:hypothetical protein